MSFPCCRAEPPSKTSTAPAAWRRATRAPRAAWGRWLAGPWGRERRALLRSLARVPPALSSCFPPAACRARSRTLPCYHLCADSVAAAETLVAPAASRPRLSWETASRRRWRTTCPTAARPSAPAGRRTTISCRQAGTSASSTSSRAASTARARTLSLAPFFFLEGEGGGRG